MSSSTYWTTMRGVEAMDDGAAVARLDRLRAGAETWEDFRLIW